MSRTTIVGIVALAVLGILIALLLRNPAPAPPAIPAAAEGIELVGYDTLGQISWIVRASSASYDDPNSALEVPEVVFYRNDAPHITLRGERLTRNPSHSSILGETTIERADGLRLSTRDVRWDERNEVLEAPEIDVEMADGQLSAAGFHYDVSTARSTFSSGVTLQLLQAGDEIQASANAAEEADGWLSLIGDVVIETSSDATYQCDRLDSTLDGETIRLSGAVEGTLQGGSFSAVLLELRPEGTRAQGDVRLKLDLQTLGADHDA